jgi:hypothetical protein
MVLQQQENPMETYVFVRNSSSLPKIFQALKDANRDCFDDFKLLTWKEMSRRAWEQIEMFAERAGKHTDNF